jgi:hypothetical protein
MNCFKFLKKFGFNKEPKEIGKDIKLVNILSFLLECDLINPDFIKLKNYKYINMLLDHGYNLTEIINNQLLNVCATGDYNTYNFIELSYKIYISDDSYIDGMKIAASCKNFDILNRIRNYHGDLISKGLYNYYTNIQRDPPYVKYLVDNQIEYLYFADIFTYAASHGDLDIIQYMVDLCDGHSRWIKDDTYMESIEAAITKDHLDIIKYLIANMDKLSIVMLETIIKKMVEYSYENYIITDIAKYANKCHDLDNNNNDINIVESIIGNYETL